MGKYKGNVGHLMQHWTLCELLEVAQAHTSGLNYIDAHAMAPWATEPTDLDDRFTNCRNALPGQKYVYERAWKALSDRHRDDDVGYPNSAAFVREVWKKDYSLLLCEIDEETVDEIRPWLARVRQDPNCRQDPELFPGDWRRRFEQGLSGPVDVALPEKSLTLVTFDPSLCSWHPDSLPKRTGDGQHWDPLRPQDLELALRALRTVKGGILVQMSTYSAQSNSQDDVIASFDSILTPGGFHRQAKVRPLNARRKPHGHMMSLVYTKGVEWATEFAGLPSRFNEWMRAIERRRG